MQCIEVLLIKLISLNRKSLGILPLVKGEAYADHREENKINI